MRAKSKQNKQHSNRRKRISSKPGEINSGTSVIFGVLPVLESLRAKSRKIKKIFFSAGKSEKRFSEIIQLAKANGIPFANVRKEEISDIVNGDVNHQGIIALTIPASYYDSGRLFNEITKKEQSLSVILDGVEDPGNLGAILRTIECMGADGVFIPDRRAVGLTETVAKSSAGATEYVKVAKVTNLNRLIDDLKQRNVWVVGTSDEAEMDYTDWDWSQSTALVLGSEGKGLHRLTAEKCDVLVKIPMHGKIESLNVSVATGVILSEAVRQRKKD